ncbi:MAG: S26 family signal peptidase [Planctomycetota bacterium]|jgi:signal peptidase I
MPCLLSTVGSRLRLWVERLVLLLVAVLVVRTWYVEGASGNLIVVSGSMAETLLGVHREVTCADCGHGFVCGADLRPVSARAICPNCGYGDNDLEARPDLAGDRVLIDKSIFQFRRPRRWEVVALRHPAEASRTLVKRVVGRPGEFICIRDGDVYAGDTNADVRIQRKELWQQRALAILVHDAEYQPKIEPAPPSRWHVADDSQWVSQGGRFARPETSDKEPEDDWLEYRHWWRVPGRAGEVRESPITDLCGYNQTRPRREEEVHPVADLLLSLRLVRTSGRGSLVIRASDGRDEFQVRIDPSRGSYEVLRNRRPVQGTAGELPSLAQGLTVEVSLFDRQLLLAFDGRVAVTVPYDPSKRRQPTSRPLAIGSLGGPEVEIRDLRVYRDVYYTHPIGLRRRRDPDEPVGLAADEYYVLGDNSPISQDSRTWAEGPAVGTKLLVGKPLLVHYPARIVELGPWRFQVPDPGKIRYIR